MDILKAEIARKRKQLEQCEVVVSSYYTTYVICGLRRCVYL